MTGSQLEVEVVQAPIEAKPVLRRLLELYLYDFTEFTGEDLNEHGEFGYPYLDHYWTSDDRETRVPLLIRAGGKLAGFALVRRAGERPWKMAEFFVMRRFRRLGVGSRAATEVFRRFPGGWEVHELAANTPAQAFWRSVIGSLTNGRFDEESNAEAVVQRFRIDG